MWTLPQPPKHATQAARARAGKLQESVPDAAWARTFDLLPSTFRLWSFDMVGCLENRLNAERLNRGPRADVAATHGCPYYREALTKARKINIWGTLVLADPKYVRLR